MNRVSTGNEHFQMTVSINDRGLPILSSMQVRSKISGRRQHIGDGSPCVLFPRIVMGGKTLDVHSDEIAFLGMERADGQQTLILRYSINQTCILRHYIKASERVPAFTTWTTLENLSGEVLEDISRFDSMHLSFNEYKTEPQAAYMLGWLQGVRMDAPGHHAVLVNSQSPQHPGMYSILDYLPQDKFKPEGGWVFPKLRLVRERLNRLPLRSGRRATYHNYPWVVVHDVRHRTGFYAGYEWSGKWGMDLEYSHQNGTVCIHTYTDGYSHDLEGKGILESPKAFIGFFEGDWDDAFNACNAYTKTEILPPPPNHYPTIYYNTVYSRYTPGPKPYLYMLADTIAKAGFEGMVINFSWYRDNLEDGGEFSNGLGDFRDNLDKIEGGLKAYSDYVHQLGLKIGLWFEFERVDIRTAMKGSHPWKPEWIVHQDGYPCRSWGQHIYSLCLGVKEAAEWALENISNSIRAYGIDWIMMDSNSWKPCHDPSHGHGTQNGEWAQIHGLYFVLDGIRKRFPGITIMNCAGGAQRGDFGLARYCDLLACDDLNEPSSVNRQYAYGVGCMYPNYYGIQSLARYASDRTAPDGHTLDIPPDVFEWRALNRIVGFFQPAYTITELNDENLQILTKVVDTYKKIRGTFHGERFTHAGPGTFLEPDREESDSWEVYEYVSPQRDVVSVVHYRCLSPEEAFCMKPRGLDPDTEYVLDSYSERYAGSKKGEQWMNEGILLKLDRMKSADVLILKKV